MATPGPAITFSQANKTGTASVSPGVDQTLKTLISGSDSKSLFKPLKKDKGKKSSSSVKRAALTGAERSPRDFSVPNEKNKPSNDLRESKLHGKSSSQVELQRDVRRIKRVQLGPMKTEGLASHLTELLSDPGSNPVDGKSEGQESQVFSQRASILKKNTLS